MPAKLRLAYTAALEHYTATIAEALLSKPEAQALLGDTEVRSILLWHALEESEHKAVAFDAYRAVGGTERMRLWGFRIMTVGLLGLVVVATLLSMLLTDRSTYNPVPAGTQPRPAAALAVPRARRDRPPARLHPRGLPPRRLRRHRAARALASRAVRARGARWPTISTDAWDARAA